MLVCFYNALLASVAAAAVVIALQCCCCCCFPLSVVVVAAVGVSVQLSPHKLAHKYLKNQLKENTNKIKNTAVKKEKKRKKILKFDWHYYVEVDVDPRSYRPTMKTLESVPIEKKNN